jgi:hypothetical protein
MKQLIKKNITGFIRYSLPFKQFAGGKDIFADPEYMNYRLSLFKEFTLKSFQNQTDKNFNLFLLHSASMPGNYRAIFDKLEQENKFLHNIFVDDDQDIPELSRYMDIDNGGYIFRIDNDDGVTNTYIEQCRRYIKPEFVGYCVNFPNEARIQKIEQNRFMLCKEIFNCSNSIGIGFVVSRKNFLNPLSFNHHCLTRRHNTILVSKLHALMTINGKNLLNSVGKEFDILTTDQVRNFFKENNFPDYNLNVLLVREKKKHRSFWWHLRHMKF